MADQVVTLKVDGDIGLIEINHPPVNSLNRQVWQGLESAFNEAWENPNLKALVLYGAGRTFVAGADISEFKELTDRATTVSVLTKMHTLLNAFEDSPVPTIAAIHGTALGGGLELAMACHYRIITPSGSVGQPEIMLGVIPGAGGTQRLPRLVSTGVALQMITTGRSVKAEQALQNGLVDRIADSEHIVEEAKRFAREVIDSGMPVRKTREQTDKLGDPVQNAMVFQFARGEVAKRAKGYIAPGKCIDAVETGVLHSFEEGLAKEAELFAECVTSDISRCLVYQFFASRECVKVPGVTDAGIKPAEIKKIGVIGAGTMGGGIAQVYAKAGCDVLLKDVKQEFLDRGMNAINKTLTNRVQQGRMSQAQMDAMLGRITPTLTYDGFDSADLVIEAALEKIDVKRSIFAELDKVCADHTILASNTSTLSIDEMAVVTNRPDKVVGLHFFSPAPVMKLLEIVRGEKTSAETLVTALGVAKLGKKTPIVVANMPGFLINRILHSYGCEAGRLLEEGASPSQIDKAALDFGWAMGPFTMMDMVGLDINYHAGEVMRKAFGQAEEDVPVIGKKLYEAGRYGQKSGAGYYRYEEGSRKPVPDPALDEFLDQVRAERGITARTDITDEEISDRLILPVVNECARALELDIVLRPGDIDVGMVYSTGFPPFRGGPMKYADSVGLAEIVSKLREYESKFGDRFAPCALLLEKAAEGETFCG